MKYKIQWLSRGGWLDIGHPYLTLEEALKGVHSYSTMFPIAEYKIEKVEDNDSN